MNARIATLAAAKATSLNLKAAPSAVVGASLRVLQFNQLLVGVTYDLPLAVGDFRLARFDAGEVGLLIESAPTEEHAPGIPDRGARIGLALAIHMGGAGMTDTSLVVWADSWDDDQYVEVYLDYHDGTHENIDLSATERPTARLPIRYDLPSRPLRMVWLLASPEVLLLSMQCSVAADA